MSTETDETPARSVPSPQIVQHASPGAVVVGVDGSEGSRSALEVACDEADLRNLPIAAVVAWTPPEVCVTPYPLVASAHDLHGAATDLATREVHEVLTARARRGASAPTVELIAASGPAAVVLERVSAEASMIVVGHRGRGAVASRLIGSVGLSTVVHARCSVLVVRTPDDRPPRFDEHESHAT